MRSFLLLAAAILPLSSAEEKPAVHRAAAAEAARHGLWRLAESHQRTALELCLLCPVEESTLLRAELAAYLLHGGFPEAAIPLWKQALIDKPGRPALLLGLGVALEAVGRPADAAKAWAQACAASAPGTPEHAACRFNIASAHLGAASSWSEMESLLPVLLRTPGALTRATVFLQTARAATLAGEYARAQLLLDQADSVIVAELDPAHPFRRGVYESRAELAEKRGDKKEARQWRKKAEKSAPASGWRAHTVSLDELKRKSR